jgi:hypothetical protein
MKQNETLLHTLYAKADRLMLIVVGCLFLISCLRCWFSGGRVASAHAFFWRRA